MSALRQQLEEAYRGLIPDTTLELEQQHRARQTLKKMERPVVERSIPVRQSIEQAWFGPSLDDVVNKRRGF